MRVVLRELADAGEARQHAGRFVAVQRRLLVKADRQIAIAAHLAGVGQEMARAVHRLQAHRLAFGFDEEHVLPVMLPVAGPLPQRLVVDERRLHLDVAGREQHVAHVVRERVVERRALAQPERGARRPRVKREETEVLADLAVVALLRFFDRVRCAFSSSSLRRRRCRRCAASAGCCASPFQYAFDVFSSLNALSRPVDGTCGPTQKSTNVSRSLIVYSETSGCPSVFSSISCTLNGSPFCAKNRFASSRGHICRW